MNVESLKDHVAKIEILKIETLKDLERLFMEQKKYLIGLLKLFHQSGNLKNQPDNEVSISCDMMRFQGTEISAVRCHNLIFSDQYQ